MTTTICHPQYIEGAEFRYICYLAHETELCYYRLYSMSHYKHLIFLSVLVFMNSPFVKSQNYIEVITEDAALIDKSGFLSPNDIPVKAGEVFKIKSYDEDWIGIHLFSDEIRFMKREDVNFIGDLLDTRDEQFDVRLCDKVSAIQSEAEEKSGAIFLTDFDERVAYEKYLFDKNMLNLLREHSISPKDTSIFIKCINDSLRVPLP